jgi:dTDP-4-amino-4,6-dideoxygalactose transaminase
MIKLASPDLRDGDLNRVVGVLKSGNLLQGEIVQLLEDKLQDFTDLPYCTLLSSGTAALHLALLALGIGQGDTVIVPAFTFPATANAVEVVGASLVFCDVDELSYVVTPEKLRECIRQNIDKNLKAMIVVHEFGFPAQMKNICEIAKSFSLKIIEDAACALGTYADGAHVGSYSDLSCYSFHPRKAITTGEGGAIITRVASLDQKVRYLRNHGIKYTEDGLDFIMAGLNYRMTDFQAALGVGQLERFRGEISKRKELAFEYLQGLASSKSWVLPKSNDGHSWQTYMIVLDELINRKQLIQELIGKGIQTNLGAQALNCLTYFQSKYALTEHSCPVATKLYRRGLALPLYGKLSIGDIRFITKTLIESKPNDV